jgi:hypothetical protein
MRLVTLDSREVGGRPGVLLPNGDILDLASPSPTLAASQWRPQSVVSVLAEGEEGASRVRRLLDEVAAAGLPAQTAWRSSGRLLPASGTQLLAPVRRPGLLLMVRAAPGQPPESYVKNPNAAVGPDSRVSVPANRDEPLSGLSMIGFVLGRPLFGATRDQASRAIAAITLVADLGVGPFGTRAIAARQFPGACVIGPAIVTLDEWPDRVVPSPVVKVNSHAFGTGAPPIVIDQAAALVAELSGNYALRPGDIVAVSTGAGDFKVGRGDRASLAVPGGLELGFTVAD